MSKGLTAGAIRGRLETGAWERVHAAVYPGGRVREDAEAIVDGGRERVEITITKTRSLRLAGVTVHRVSQLSGIDIVWIDHIPVTTAARTLADLAAVLTRRDLAGALGSTLPSSASSSASRPTATGSTQA